MLRGGHDHDVVARRGGYSDNQLDLPITPTVRLEPGRSGEPFLCLDEYGPYAQTILQLFALETAGNPELAKQLQSELQRIQQTPEAWGLISGLASHDDPNVRFFSAHTAQVKISRDW